MNLLQKLSSLFIIVLVFYALAIICFSIYLSLTIYGFIANGMEASECLNNCLKYAALIGELLN